jgi:hypothetical protein
MIMGTVLVGVEAHRLSEDCKRSVSGQSYPRFWLRSLIQVFWIASPALFAVLAKIRK